MKFLTDHLGTFWGRRPKEPNLEKENIIKDDLGRSYRKLRVSLLDACNFKCNYCMPISPEFMNTRALLPPEEIEQIVEQLIYYGIEEVRLTGGEPLLRRDILEIIERLSKLPLNRLAMTTNAFGLEKKAEELKKAGLHSVNISLDTLDRQRFREITKVDGLQQVLRGINKAKEIGLEVKINAVAMRGTTDREIWDFVEFSRQHNIEVRFLESMKIGVMIEQFEETFISAQELINLISERYHLTSISMAKDSTSFNYLTDHGSQIGFIASETRPFCGNCSRLRLGANGTLYTCLMSDYGTDIRGKSREELKPILRNLLDNKPKERKEKRKRPMNQLGG